MDREQPPTKKLKSSAMAKAVVTGRPPKGKGKAKPDNMIGRFFRQLGDDLEDRIDANRRQIDVDFGGKSKSTQIKLAVL